MPWFITSIISANKIKDMVPSKSLRSRTFGFYNSYNDAYKAIRSNTGNMQESLYD